MTAKIVCRLLDAENNLLGWVEHHAAVRGDGYLRSDGPVAIHVDRAGTPVIVSLHWCEVNTETRVPCPNISVEPGQELIICTPGMPMIRVGPTPIGLPPVTVGKPVAIGVPVGAMGARADQVSVMG